MVRSGAGGKGKRPRAPASRAELGGARSARGGGSPSPRQVVEGLREGGGDAVRPSVPVDEARATLALGTAWLEGPEGRRSARWNGVQNSCAETPGSGPGLRPGTRDLEEAAAEA